MCVDNRDPLAQQFGRSDDGGVLRVLGAEDVLDELGRTITGPSVSVQCCHPGVGCFHCSRNFFRSLSDSCGKIGPEGGWPIMA